MPGVFLANDPGPPSAGVPDAGAPSDAGAIAGAPGSGATGSGADAGSPVAGGSTPCPTTCSITSETEATSPANQARTRIGVGEEVDLTVNPGPASWAITSGGGSLSPSTGSRTRVTYAADDTAGSVTITATGAGCSCSITFTVVEPSSWTQKRKPGSNLKHTHGRPDCGFKGIVYLHPDDVNFYNVETREMDSLSVATGSYNPSHHGKWHGNYPPPDGAGPWIPIVSHTDADGSKYGGEDEVYSGYPSNAATGNTPPFNQGTYYWPITRQWRVGTRPPHNFPAVRQEHEIFADGKCESRKGGNTEHTMWNDATSTY